MPILEIVAMACIAYAGLSEICRVYIGGHVLYSYWIPHAARDICARVNVREHTRSWTLSALANSRAHAQFCCRPLIKADEICAICLDPFAETDAKAAPEPSLSEIRRCGHVFCEECICQWLSSHRTCPLCSQDVTELSAESREEDDKPSATSDWFMLHQT
jgi:hypothetical protein